MTMNEDFKQYVGQTSPESLQFDLSKAEGSYLFDTEGKKYLDFHSGVGVMNLGHQNRVVNEFIKTQVDHYSHTMVYGEHVQESQVQLAKALSLQIDALDHSQSIHPHPDKQVFFANTGNEAIDLAIKTVRKFTGRKGLVALEKAFHGRGYGAMQLTWNQEYKEGFFVDDGETDWIDPLAEDIQSELDKISWESKSAVFVEYVQGEAGARPVPVEFLKALRERCTHEGVFLVADEVQTGFGRTGSLFAQETFGVTADITCLGKAGGGGLPFGAVVADKILFEELQKPALSHISTFAGNPVVCAGGLGVLTQLTPQVLESSKKVSEVLEEGVSTLMKDYPEIIVGFSGVGMLRGLHLSGPATAHTFYWKCVEAGLLLHFKLNAGAVLRVSPPINLTENDAEDALAIMEFVCEMISEEKAG